MSHSLQSLAYVYPVKIKDSVTLINSYKVDQKYGDSILVSKLKPRNCPTQYHTGLRIMPSLWKGATKLPGISQYFTRAQAIIFRYIDFCFECLLSTFPCVKQGHESI